MSAAGITRAGRRKAESLMVDTCTIKPITGNTTNPDGTVTTTYGAAVYSGKCKLQNQRIPYPQNPQAGEHAWTVGPVELHVPVAATGIETDHLVEITASFDSANVGRKFRVRSASRKTFQTALRVLIEEVTG